MSAYLIANKNLPDTAMDIVKEFCSNANVIVLYGSRIGGWNTQKSDLDVLSLHNKNIEHKIVTVDNTFPISVREVSIKEFKNNEASLFSRIPILPSITLKGENQWKIIKNEIKESVYDSSIKGIIEEMKWAGAEYIRLPKQILACQPFVTECLVDPSFSYKVKKFYEQDFFKKLSVAPNINVPYEDGNYLININDHENVKGKSSEEEMLGYTRTYIRRKRRNLNSILKGSSKIKSGLILSASAFIESSKALNRVEVYSFFKKKYGNDVKGVYDGFGIDDILKMPEYTFERRIKQALSF